MQDAVGGQVFAEVGHPARNAEREHVVADEGLLDVFHDFGVGQVQHAGVEGRRFYMVDAAVRTADEVALLRALLIEAAAFHEIRIDVGEEADALFAELCDRLLQTGIEFFAHFPVPPDLLAHDRAVLSAPVLAPDAGDPRTGFLQGKGFFQHALRSALYAHDHAVQAPVGQVLPHRMEPGKTPCLFAEAVRLREDHLLRAGIEAETVKAAVQAAHTVVGRFEKHHKASVRYKDGHRRVAADLPMRFFLVKRSGQERFFDDRLRLDVFRDEIDHRFALQIDLPVLFAAAEDAFLRIGRQGKFIAPAFFAADLQTQHPFPGFGKVHTDETAFRRKEERSVFVRFQFGQGDPGLFHDGLLHGPAVRHIGLFLPDRENEGFFRRMHGDGPAAESHGPDTVFNMGTVHVFSFSADAGSHPLSSAGLPLPGEGIRRP